MHAVVVARDGLDIEVAESVDLQLESQSWLQMTVDGVLFKLLEEREEREKMNNDVYYIYMYIPIL